MLFADHCYFCLVAIGLTVFIIELEFFIVSVCLEQLSMILPIGQELW